MGHDQGVKPLLADKARAIALKNEAIYLPYWDLSFRQICDIELLLNGALSPLAGYMGRGDYEGVRDGMRLADGTLWPIPITLDVSEELAGSLKTGDRVALRHPEGVVLAVLTVSDIWQADRSLEAQRVLDTTDEKHPWVFELLHQFNPIYLGGTVEGVELPPHHTFRRLRHTPGQLRAEFRRLGWSRVIALHTRNPMHRAHVELARRAAAEVDGNLLIHPVVGRTVFGDVDYFTRIRCYEAILDRFPVNSTMISLVPLTSRRAGPREALWHAIIRRNYGCTHLIVGHNHAGPLHSATGEAFYGASDAQGLAKTHAKELGIDVVTCDEMVYSEDHGQYVPRSEVSNEARILGLSVAELKRRLPVGADIPKWFSYPTVIRELRRRYPDRSRQGFTVFFTGLSSSGKSTIANILRAKLMEIGSRPVTLLDGDIVRTNLSNELGFSKEHRDINIRRIGFVASEITKNRGIAICAPIAPYERIRRENRELIGSVGTYIEVFVSTPLEVCEERDRKGLYAKARAGLVKGVTGVDDPYEIPETPEIVIDTTRMSAEEAAQEILLYLEHEGFIGPLGPNDSGGTHGEHD